MSDFNEGDLVEAVRGESVIRGRLKRGTFEYNEEFVYVGDSADYRTYLKDGWTLKTIEKAAPPLPTEKGWYLANTGVAVYLAADGYWTTPASFGVTGEDMSEYGPFIRMEPAAITAGKVLDALRKRIGSIDSAHDFQAVAAEFGVTE